MNSIVHKKLAPKPEFKATRKHQFSQYFLNILQIVYVPPTHTVRTIFLLPKVHAHKSPYHIDITKVCYAHLLPKFH